MSKGSSRIVQLPDGRLDKISCIRWAKENGLNLPDWCWEQLEEHDKRIREQVANQDKFNE